MPKNNLYKINKENKMNFLGHQCKIKENLVKILYNLKIL